MSTYLHGGTRALQQYNVHVKHLHAQLQTASLGFVCEPSTFSRWNGNPPVCLSVPGRRAGLQESVSGSQSLQVGFFLHRLRCVSLLLGLVLTSGGYAVAVCVHSYFHTAFCSSSWLHFVRSTFWLSCYAGVIWPWGMPNCLDIFAEILLLIWVAFSMFTLVPSVSDICSWRGQQTWAQTQIRQVWIQDKPWSDQV